MRAQSVAIRFEQAVYGSFPFWDKGYAVLARSPGCRPEWVAELCAACQRFGERPGGVVAVGGLFAIRLACGPWMIVGVGSPGSDDRGRPGALAFHALFVSPRDYRRAGCNPFALAGALRDDWSAATRDLPAGTWTVAPVEPSSGPPDPRAGSIAIALANGRRVAIESTTPIDALARQVWTALPERARRRASLATWAFGNGNRFDLVALPRLAGVERDASYLDPSVLDLEKDSEEARVPLGRDVDSRPVRRAILLACAAILAGIILGLLWRRGDGLARSLPETPASRPSHAPQPEPPDRSAYDKAQDDPDERRRVSEALAALADRFGVAGVSARAHDPTALMTLLSDRLRYRGPTLSADELARLSARADRDGRHAMLWHARIARFADDRPLPYDFAQGPLRWQLDTLAWSFHLDPVRAGSGRSAAEVPDALSEALAVDVLLNHPSPALSASHPALLAYHRFLRGLPRR